MIKLGIIYRIIDSESIQVKDLTDGELYKVKGDANSIADIRTAFNGKDLPEDSKDDYLIEYDDELMQMEV